MLDIKKFTIEETSNPAAIFCLNYDKEAILDILKDGSIRRIGNVAQSLGFTLDSLGRVHFCTPPETP